MNSTNIILITRPLSEFLEIMWGIRDFSIVNYELGLEISQLDKDEIFSHVEFDNFIHTSREARDLSNTSKVAKVWRKKDWVISEKKYLSDKAESEIRVAEHNRKKEVLDRVTVALAEQFGTNRDDDMVKSMAYKMVNLKKIEAIKALCEGLEITAEEL